MGVYPQFAFGAIVVFNRTSHGAQRDGRCLAWCTLAGAKLVFGDLATLSGEHIDSKVSCSVMQMMSATLHSSYYRPSNFACLTAVLYHIGIMQYVVQGLAWTMSRSMGTSGAETLSSATNIFVGQTEASLMVKPFLAGATNSEMMAIMVAGFANIAWACGDYNGVAKTVSA